MMIRKIIHVDMDAFFASVEQRDNPELRGKPIAVGGSSARGVVAAASYEARRFGVRSAMPSVTAARLCPSLIFVRSNFEQYKKVSAQIRRIFLDYTDLVEPLSLDEAYLDVTYNKKNIPSATLIATEIRKRIFEETQLTCSAGISINKFLAKIASDLNKPNGQKLIKPQDALAFIEKLDIAKFPYVGKVTSQKMYQLGIFTGADLKKYELPDLIRIFGKQGQYYYNVVRCEQNSPVVPNRVRKSVGTERTYATDLSTQSELEKQLDVLVKELFQRLQRSNSRGRTLTLKLKDHNFSISTRSRSFERPVHDEAEIARFALELLNSQKNPDFVRLMGLSVSNLDTEKEEMKPGTQLTLAF